jgi:hypothetical protein
MASKPLRGPSHLLPAPAQGVLQLHFLDQRTNRC